MYKTEPARDYFIDKPNATEILDSDIGGRRPRADFNNFAVITVISNPMRYKKRYELYWKFAEMCRMSGVRLITVEQAFGDSEFILTARDNPDHVQLRTVEVVWHKENMINIGIRHARQVHPNLTKVAWVDADCFPMTMNPREWFAKTIHSLDHYEFVQMWEYLINFGPQGQPVSGAQMSFMACYAAAGFQIPEGKNVKHTLSGNSGMITLGRPGLAWAANLNSLDKVGGLIDFCIIGSGDWHMAHGLVGGMIQGSAEHKFLSEYSKKLFHWQELAERHIKRDVGFVPVTVGHEWHGDKQNRRYGDRGTILISNGYNPNTDIKYDTQGLIQLERYEPRQVKMYDQIRGYFGGRNEDSVDVL